MFLSIPQSERRMYAKLAEREQLSKRMHRVRKDQRDATMSNNAITEMFTDMIDEWIRENTQTINQMLTERVTQSVMPGLTVAAIESIKTKLNYTTEQEMELLSVPQSERSC